MCFRSIENTFCFETKFKVGLIEKNLGTVVQRLTKVISRERLESAISTDSRTTIRKRKVTKMEYLGGVILYP